MVLQHALRRTRARSSLPQKPAFDGFFPTQVSSLARASFSAPAANSRPPERGGISAVRRAFRRIHVLRDRRQIATRART